MRSVPFWLVVIVAVARGWAAPASGETVRGKVVERIDAGGYTYLRLEGPSGEQWAAVRPTALQAGAQAEIVVDTVMEKFKSDALKRTFPSIVFGSLASEGRPAAAPRGDPHGLGKKTLSAAQLRAIRVAKAEGPEGRTVAEVFDQRKALAGGQVAVAGKVVKVLRGIMGKNWLHLRDGTGREKDRTHDLVVTSTEEAEVGDVVTARGRLAADKDLGAGYVYAALLEDAKLTPSKR